MRTLRLIGLLLLGGLLVRPAAAAFVYDLEAVTGQIAGSTLTGSITLPNATAGLTVWNLNVASTFSFASTFGGGLSWGPANLVNSDDVRFDAGIGAAILIPTLPDATPGYAPDWRLDTLPLGITGSFALGLGHDLARPIWNLVELGTAGNQDFGDTLPGGPPAWRLVLSSVPEPTTLLLLGLGIAGLGFARRRLH